MITLAAQDITSTAKMFNGTTLTTVTDTLFVSYIEINFASGTVVAMIQRGTMVNGVFTVNYPTMRVDVAPDGTFQSQDGLWSGTIPNWTASLSAIAAPFDGLLLSSTVTSGTVIKGSL